MVLAGKQTQRSVEEHREPRNKSRHVQSTDIRQCGEEYSMAKAVFSISDVGKIRYPHANKLNRTPSQNLTSSELKM